MKRRDEYLDFYRGIAVLSVMFIHTTFHSGSSYIPAVMRTISLLLDVPFFMFLTGWSAWYSHRPERILSSIGDIWKKWLFFLLSLNVALMLLGRDRLSSPGEWLSAFFVTGYPVEGFSSIGASLWYLPVYIMILMVGIPMLYVFDRVSAGMKLKLSVLGFLVLGLAYVSIGGGRTWFYLSNHFLFYMAMFLLGYLSKEIRIKNLFGYIVTAAGCVLLWYLSSRAYGIAAKGLQGAKFPSHIMYFFASMISVSTALYLKGRIDFICRNRFIQSLGKEAIWYYFTQGIGASLLYSIVPKLPFELWWAKMICAFLINAAISIILAKGLIFAYGKISPLIGKCHLLKISDLFEIN